MSADAGAVLKLLDTGVRAVDTARRVAPDVVNGDFAGLLSRANELAPRRGVDVAPDVGQRLELNADQQARLSEAVDRAELSGVRRVLVMLDGHELVVDVADRVVLFDEALSDGGLVANVDGVVRADAPGADGGGEAAVPAEGLKLSHRSLLELLSGSSDGVQS